MLARRRFMFFLGGVTAGLWLPTTGLVPVEHAFVLQHGGTCSFCGKHTREVRALVGKCGAIPRICNECILLCCDIIREQMEAQGQRAPGYTSHPVIEAQRLAERYRIDDLIRQRAAREEAMLARMTKDEREAVLQQRARRAAEIQEVLDSLRNQPEDRLEREPVSRPVDEFHCSFCGAARREVAKLISGPRVFICDVCTGDAVSVLARVLPA
jgi:hypothetical protein